MWHFLSAVILIISFNLYDSVNGYKWVSLRDGEDLPDNTVLLNPDSRTYVGRVFKFNVILPVEIVNSSYAIGFGLKTGKYVISENKLEILTSTEDCEWNEIDDLSDVPENVVRAGQAWNREPIYLGRTSVYDVASILLSSKKFLSPKEGIFRFALTCGDNKSKWINTYPPTIPIGAVGINKESFLARLVGPVSFIPARVYNNFHMCSAVYNYFEAYSNNCEVLVGDKDEYNWQSPTKFEIIPENALVIGKSTEDEFIYAYRDDFKSLGSATFSELVFKTFIREILSRNE